MRTLLGTAAFVVVVAALSGCENWPLYLHLPDPDRTAPVPIELDLVEDPTVADGTIQSLGALTAPTDVELTGSVQSCGFDPDDDSVVWPIHPVDSDGDGEPDGEAAISGWYSGDVDLYGIEADGDGWLSVSLRWDNSPPGDLNAPYRPDDEDADWVDESDLDFVVFAVEGEATTEVLSDAGVSRTHPEQTAQVIPVADGEQVAVAVACHHEVATAYTVVLRLTVP